VVCLYLLPGEYFANIFSNLARRIFCQHFQQSASQDLTFCAKHFSPTLLTLGPVCPPHPFSVSPIPCHIPNPALSAHRRPHLHRSEQIEFAR
jgi:hypothetical protein